MYLQYMRVESNAILSKQTVLERGTLELSWMALYFSVLCMYMRVYCLVPRPTNRPGYEAREQTMLKNEILGTRLASIMPSII